MKKIKKLLTTLFAVLLMLCMSISLSACKKNKYSTETDPSKYLGFELLEDGTYQVNGFVDLPVLHLVIPSTYNNIPVTKISIPINTKIAPPKIVALFENFIPNFLPISRPATQMKKVTTPMSRQASRAPTKL